MKTDKPVRTYIIYYIIIILYGPVAVVVTVFMGQLCKDIIYIYYMSILYHAIISVSNIFFGR